MTEYMNFPAVQTEHANGRAIYAFPIDGKDILKIASVSKFERMDDGEILGFQRGEAKQHISQISEYVKKVDAMIPNAIVIAFRDDGIIFEKSDEGDFGTLKIPHDPNSNEVPGFIVDGQQRTMAIKNAIQDPKSEIQSFPMIVCAFIESDPATLIDQFVLINKSKNLPSGLIYELIPESTLTGDIWDTIKFSASLVTKLEEQEDSPFYSLIKSEGRKGGKIPRNSLITPYKVLSKNGHSFIDEKFPDGKFLGDIDELVEQIKTYWIAVRDVFEDSWSPDMKKSRIMHGTSIWALAHLQDEIMSFYRRPDSLELNEYKSSLEFIQGYCHWTEEDGHWIGVHPLDPNNEEPWDFFQNTPKDKATLTRFLVRKFRELSS